MSSWLLGHPDDTRDALIEAALAGLPEARVAWDRLVSAGIGSRRDGVAARWLPLVHHNIGHSLSEHRSLQMLRQADHQAWAHAVSLATTAAPVMKALRQAGVDPVLLKGAALATSVYPHPGMRPFGDVDVLVRPEQFALARSILAAQGWTSPPPVGPAGDEAHAQHFSGPSRGVIDLHRYVLVDTSWPDADTALWQRVEPVVSGDVEVGVLSPADQLLHTCVHGIRWSPVHAATWVADATWIVRQTRDRLDWDVLIDEAKRRRLNYQVGEALDLVGRVGGVDIPPHVVVALRARATFAEQLECRVKVRPPRGLSGMLMYWLSWRRHVRGSRSSQQTFLRYFAGAAGVRSRREFRGWIGRYAERQLSGRRQAPRSDGRSREPTLKP